MSKVIKVIKIGDNVYQGVEPFALNENGELAPFNPVLNDFASLQAAVIDTHNWLIGREVKKALGDEFAKLSAANSKAVALLAKQIKSLSPTATLTTKEQQAFDALVALADGGYADSDLLLGSLQAVNDAFATYNPKIQAALAATTTDELIALLS